MIRRAVKADFPTLRMFVNLHHSYIPWRDRPSRKLYWLLYEDQELVGVWGLMSACWGPTCVKSFMKNRGIEYNQMANNSMYCLSEHRDRNAGTKFLKLLRRDAVLWWAERYGDSLKALQTFILPPKTGAIYKADNWIMLGKTTGSYDSFKTVPKGEVESYKERGLKVREWIAKGENGLPYTKYVVNTQIKTEPKLIFSRVL